MARGNARFVVLGAAIAATVLLLFLPAIGFPFLNWDDQDIFVRNAALRAPGFVRWAFTTTYLEHFQPGAWLVWGTLDRVWGLTPAASHALNVAMHAICAVLVFVLAERIGIGRVTGFVAALLFALHPLRVEAVAWASAMPYLLALLFALLSTLAFLDAAPHPRMLGLSIALFAASLLARPVALGLPGALFALYWWKGVRDDSRAGRMVPFIALAAAAAYLESRARLTATLTEVGIGARLTLAFAAPFKYLWRTVVPLNLTPLDPLALSPHADVPLMIASGGALAAVSWAAWRWRRRHPGAAVAWFSYLSLLLPAVGLVPSGLQATADRYMYLPAVPVSLWIAGAVYANGGLRSRPYVVSGFSRTWFSRTWLRPTAAAVAAAIVALAILSHQQMQYWRDSIALWTRAVEIDPQSDVALYNLASALAEAGRGADALVKYEEVLRVVPDHPDARRNRDLLRAAQLENDANRLASAGKLEAAIERYREAIALDPARTHSQAALGMALVQSGRTAEAVAPLREAIRLGAPEPPVFNALAFSLFAAGRTRDACEVLEAARVRFPGNADIARNLAQLAGECAK